MLGTSKTYSISRKSKVNKKSNTTSKRLSPHFDFPADTYEKERRLFHLNFFVMVLKNTVFNLTLYAIESRYEKGLKIDSITHSANIFFTNIYPWC